MNVVLSATLHFPLPGGKYIPRNKKQGKAKISASAENEGFGPLKLESEERILVSFMKKNTQQRNTNKEQFSYFVKYGFRNKTT